MQRLWFGGLFLLVVACGPSTTDDASSVRSQSQELQALVEGHVTSASSSQPTCSAEMEAYRSRANQLLGSLRGMCPGLDACMSGMGHGEQADMASAVKDLEIELDAHVAGACAATDVAAEMARHRSAMVMVTHCQHLVTRSEAVVGMMGTRGMMVSRGCR